MLKKFQLRKKFPKKGGDAKKISSCAKIANKRRGCSKNFHFWKKIAALRAGGRELFDLHAYY